MPRIKTLKSKDQIIDISFDIVDAEGINALSIRKIAKGLEISSMTIYNYVQDLNDIKKEIIIKAFDGLYAGMYSALTASSVPVNEKALCKQLATQVFAFAQAHRGVYVFMFTEGQILFGGDAELRPFYEFFSSFMTKKLRSKKQEKAMAFDAFEMTVFSVVLRCALGAKEMSADSFEKYVDYLIDRLV